MQIFPSKGLDSDVNIRLSPLQKGQLFMIFETPSVERFCYWLIARFPQLNPFQKEIFQHFSKVYFPDIPIPCHECFGHFLEFDGLPKEIYIIWDIEKLISYRPSFDMFGYALTSQLLPLQRKNVGADRTLYNFNAISLSHSHRSPFLTIVHIPAMNDDILIDGNHRVMEAVKRGRNDAFPIVYLTDERMLEFLYPESRKFIEGMFFIAHLPIK